MGPPTASRANRPPIGEEPRSARAFDVHPDGGALVLVRPQVESRRDIVVVLDWLTDLRRATGG